MSSDTETELGAKTTRKPMFRFRFAGSFLFR